jgi:hypothetical protein
MALIRGKGVSLFPDEESCKAELSFVYFSYLI